MPVPLSQAPFPFERHDIRSGPITRPGFPDFGVIFSSQINASPQSYHPADLEGAVIEVLELQQKGDPNRFFTILGGYFCERNPGGRPNEVAISRIFGVALDASLGFGLQPGNNCLVDHWEMKDLSGSGRKNMMDERSKGENGWTFIVNFKPFRQQYPYSGKFMGITRECPQLLTLELTTGTSLEKEVEVLASATIFQGPVRGYRWDWGDGSQPEETFTPSASHKYSRSGGQDQSYQVTLSILGPDGCSASLSQPFLVPGYCPVMKFASTELTYPGTEEARVTAQLAGNHEPGMRYSWNWGDGSPVDNTDLPQASHPYLRSNVSAPFTIQVEILGPGSCQAHLSSSVVVAPKPCPEVSAIRVLTGSLNGDLFVVSVEADVLRGPADHFVWNWGDGSATETTTKPEASHSFTPGQGEALQRTVTVTAMGPGSACQNSLSTVVTIPGQCPVVALAAKVLNVTDLDALVELALKATGPAPAQWTITWGDGSPAEVVTGLTATHRYQRPAGDAQHIDILARAEGPGNCLSSTSTSVMVPGACPAIESVEWSWLEQTGGTWLLEASVTVLGPRPNQLTWDWGDGSPVESGVATTLQHAYPGLPGESRSFTLTVEASGPGSCSSTHSELIEVPPLPCATLRQLTVSPGAITNDHQTFHFSATFDGPTPTSFRWNWGDGSPEETTLVAQASHDFARQAGQPMSYQVRFTSSGPGVCSLQSETSVSLDAYCPLPGQLSLQLVPAAGDSYEVQATLDVQGPPPASFTWNWGDGSPEETTPLPSALHTYAAKPGLAQALTVSVTTSGPGVCPDQTVQQALHIPAGCPTADLVRVVAQSQTDTEASFDLEVTGAGQAESYVWNFGDGSPQVTTTARTVSHQYPRWAGHAPEFEITVDLIGPGPCRSRASTRVVVPAGEVCPIISRIDTYLASETATHVRMGFIPVTLQGAPGSYTWNFGDGSAPLTTTDPEVVHEFSRQAGPLLTVSVASSGPNTCSASQSVEVRLPGTTACPVIGQLAVSGKAGTQANSWVADAQVEVLSGKPDRYLWDAGAGTVTTLQPLASFTFDQATQARKQTIKVVAEGPGTCRSEATALVEIPARKVKDPWCERWPWLVALLGGLSIGGWLVCPADLAEGSPSSWLGWVLFLIMGLWAASIWWWDRQGRRKGCPPGICDGLAIGWSSLLASTGVAFLLQGCLPGWIFWGLGSLLLAAVFGWLWFQRCARKAGARVFWIYFGVSVLAFALVALLLAMPALTCV